VHEGAFPLIVRPIDSHAGRGLEKLENAAAIAGYLADRPEDEFFISRFIDYSNPDGLFRKFRVIVIDGRPFPCHMAVAAEWKLWYLNADMAQSASKRGEEARFMEGFDEGFAQRHGAALAAMDDRFGLEYFGIDCAELADGRLLVFEADISMAVHELDPVDIYPYKGPQMRKLFAAFVDMLARKADQGGLRP
jgi:glutathione synthase/RimK-type ligase-like ATP-grasp enzyme